jgi:hypothetical protein
LLATYAVQEAHTDRQNRQSVPERRVGTDQIPAALPPPRRSRVAARPVIIV